ncbi:MAG TPA: efflux RND transporter periplasmic adaptor subunit [Bryobacteraceae bacterium]|jgi:cobalt-zinc-cadmium efflux system membrane fusion protein
MRCVYFIALSGALLSAIVTGCGSRHSANAAQSAPPPSQVEEEPDLNIVKVDRPERFSLVTAAQREALAELHATGVVNADIEKSVPVISLASGRVVGIYAKLGDDVKRGQLLLKVLSNDISSAFQNYQQAKADEELARRQLDRAKLLYERGAISLNDLQVAEDTEKKAAVSVNAISQQVQTLGGNVNNPDPIVNIYAPVSGTIVEQNVANAGGVRTPDNQPNLFTIADLSTVWVICNVYENDLPDVRVGDPAEVELNAYPQQKFRGRISNIGKVLDPAVRTAPVRITISNPGMMRTGMFVTATFYGQHGRIYTTVPSGAVLHLHDRDWVFLPVGKQEFRRSEVTVGQIVDGRQDILSGITPGTQLVNDALALSSESQQ